MIGEARTVSGTVTAIKAGGVRVSLAPGMTVDQGDVIETGPNSSVGLLFIDKTVFSLGANARMTLDDLVFSSTGSDHSTFSVLGGAFSFISGDIGRTPEAMRVRTPVGTIGIRGTQVAGNDQLVILLSQDGHVGSIILNGQVILDQENQAFLASGQTTFLSPQQVQELFSGILRLLPLIRGNLDSLDTNVAQLGQIQQLDGGASFTAGGLQFVFFERGPLGLGLEITGPLPPELDFFRQFFPPPESEPGKLPEVIDLNEPPAASDDGGAVTEAGGTNNVDPGVPTATGNLTDNVSDPDNNETLSFAGDASGTYGVLAVDENSGEWTYTLNNSDSDTEALNQDQTAVETFTYTVADQLGLTATATITVTITGVNDDPTANNDGATITEDGAGTVSGSLSDNVSDVDNAGNLTDDLDFLINGSSANLGTYGELTHLNQETGAWSYSLYGAATDELNAGETKVDTFTYTVNDEHGATATALLQITIVGTNDNPTATNDFGGYLSEDGVHVENSPGPDPTRSGTLSDNVYDVDNGGDLTDDLDFSVGGSGGTYGVLTLNSETGAWTYSLDNSDTDTDSLNRTETAVEQFTYTVIDESGGTATATLTISIYGANDAPTAEDTGDTVTEAGGANNSVTGLATVEGSLLGSDVDNGGVYTDDLDFVINGVSYSAVTTYGQLSYDSDTGAWSYTLNDSDSDTEGLNKGETAAETFTYVVSDEDGATASATLIITIVGANDDPTATADFGGGVTEAGGEVYGGNYEETPGTPTVSGTLADNVSDIDNGGLLTDDLDFTTNGAGTYGTLTLDTETGDWTYSLDNSDTDTDSLNEGETATETYTYTVTDESSATATETLTITIVGTNDAPTATEAFGGPMTESGGEVFSFAIPQVTGALADSVSDVDNAGVLTDDLDFDVTGLYTSFGDNGTYGNLTLDTETGDWTYELTDFDTDTDALNEGETVTETYTFVVRDEHGATASSTLSITILGANDVPTANDESGFVVVPGQLEHTGTLSDNVSDVDNAGAQTDDLDFLVNGSGSASGTYGVLTLNTESGEWTYSLDPSDDDTVSLGSQSATETFTYTVVDEHGLTATATLVVTINGDLTAVDETASVSEAGGYFYDDPGTPSTTGTLADNVQNIDPESADFYIDGIGLTYGDLSATYGKLFLDTDTGDWTYQLDNSDYDTQALNAGEPRPSCSPIR